MRKIIENNKKGGSVAEILPQYGISEAPKQEFQKPHPLQNLTTLDIVNLRREKSGKIINWIKDRPSFKYSIMCDEVGIDRGNFSRLLRKKNAKITLELIAKIETYISKYGYKP